MLTAVLKAVKDAVLHKDHVLPTAAHNHQPTETYPSLRVDNKSAIALAKNPVFHDRSEHIRVKEHFIRYCIEEGSIKTEYIPTADQFADILTKALGKAKLEDMRSRIG